LLSSAQDSTYARGLINKLCSDEFSGRGYVDDGTNKASSFIADEFKKNGLQPIEDSFFQNLSTSVNTFPHNVDVWINKKKLKPGNDFIINACCPSVTGEFKTYRLDKADLVDGESFNAAVKKAKGKMIVIDGSDLDRKDKKGNQQLNEAYHFLTHYNRSLARGVVVIRKKLTWTGSNKVCPYPGIEILDSMVVQEKIKTIRIFVENEFVDEFQIRNVIGHIKGSIWPDSFLVFTAHYDHLGKMGDSALFTGANDNASGTAMLMDLARHFSLPENNPKMSMAFIAFAGEEMGLLGSTYFTENPLFPLDKIGFLINMDIMGTGDEGITVVNGKVFKDHFDQLVHLNDSLALVPEVKIRGEACNSDHCPFYKKEVPSFFIYTRGGIQAYHDVYDRPETLPLTEYNHLFKLIKSFSGYLQND